jgi:hypothetical protein
VAPVIAIGPTRTITAFAAAGCAPAVRREAESLPDR